MEFNSGPQLAEYLSQSYAQAQTQLKALLAKDTLLQRRDTARAIVRVLEGVQKAMSVIFKVDDYVQEGAYWSLYNGTTLLFSACRKLRGSVFAKETTRFLAFSMLCMESIVVLTSTRHLPWRLTLYRELASVYEQLGATKAAGKVITHALQKIQLLKEIEAAEAPEPDAIRDILSRAALEMKALEMKYGLLNNAIPLDQWKKRLDEAPDKLSKIKLAMETLKVNKGGQGRVIQQLGYKSNYKSLISSYIYDLMANELKVVCQALEEQAAKRKRDHHLLEVTRQAAIALPEVDEYGERVATGESREAVLAKNREEDAKMIKEAVWRPASESVPLELHLELAKHCYDCKVWDNFYNLSQWAEIRIKHRRLETPFISDVDVIYSSIPDSKIPRGFEKIDVDLNIANFKIELAKLAPIVPSAREEEKKPQAGAKGAVKKPPAKEVRKESEEPEYDLSSIDHSFVYLVVRRTSEEREAIKSIDLVMGDVVRGPHLKENQKAVALPIKLHSGERSNQVPYLVLSMPHPEEELMPLDFLVDLQPLIGKHELTSAAPGYHKLPFDLRQTPKDLGRIANNTYVFLTYKTDAEFYSQVREFQLMATLRKLEQNRDTKDYLTDSHKYLGVKWEPALLAALSDCLNDLVSGTLGLDFTERSPDVLVDVCLKIFSEFVNPVLKLKQVADDHLRQEELTGDLAEQVRNLWTEVKPVLIAGLDSAYRILLSKVDARDPNAIIKTGFALAQLFEEEGDLRSSARTWQTVASRILAAREDNYRRGVVAAEDVPFSHMVSGDSQTVTVLEQKMHAKLQEWITAVMAEAATAYDDKPTLSELELTLNTWHLDALTNYYRCQLKLDRYEIGTRTHNKKETIKGITQALFTKANLNKGKTATKLKKDANALQKTLQESGKVPPNKPKLTATEKQLAQESGKNHYQLALLKMQMAKIRINPQEQKALLKECIEHLEKADAQENRLIEVAVASAVEIFSSSAYNFASKETHLDHPLFKLLADDRFTHPTSKPGRPVVVARTSTTMAVKMTYFRPKIIDRFSLKSCSSYALFGKEAKSGTEVTLSNTDLAGLGAKVLQETIVLLEGLRPNEEYHFAEACYNLNGELMGSIGESCEPVVTLVPLPLLTLWSYLCQTAFSLNHYALAVKAAERVLSAFTRKNQPFKLLTSRLRRFTVQNSSRSQLHHFVNSVLVYAHCLVTSDLTKENLRVVRDPAYIVSAHLDRQDKYLKLCNLLLLALEVSVDIADMVLIKRTLHEVFNTVVDQFKLKGGAQWVCQVLAKCHCAVRRVSPEYWDRSFRKLVACINYNLFRCSFAISEAALVPTALLSDLKQPRIKYVLKTKKSGEVVIKGIEPAEHESFALFESMLQYPELQDLAKTMGDHWKEQLSSFTGKLTDQAGAASDQPAQEERKRYEEMVDLYTAFKTAPDAGLSKINTVYRESPRFLEYLCKSIFVLLQKTTDYTALTTQLAAVNVPEVPYITKAIEVRMEEFAKDSYVPDHTALVDVPRPSDYLMLWNSERYFLKACISILARLKPAEVEESLFLNISNIDIGRLVKPDDYTAPGLADTLKLLVCAAGAATAVKAWSQLLNICRTTWNLLSLRAVGPGEVAQEDSWKLLAVFAEQLLIYLEAARLEPEDTTRQPTVEFATGFQSSLGPASLTAMTAFELDSGVPWFVRRPELEVPFVANLAGFCFQAVFMTKKWNCLVDLCDRFNALTSNHYAGPVLPLKVYAEHALLERASGKTKEQQEALAARTEAYELWKSSTKRKKSRQVMLTGELPPEQIEFEADRARLLQVIDKRKAKEAIFRDKLQSSQSQLDQIKASSNSGLESLMQARRLLEQYSLEAKALQVEESEAAGRMKRKAHKVFANMVLSSYRKTVTIMRRRQEKQWLAVTLHELGCLSFSEGLLEEAESSWSDSVDTTFQALYVISNYREILGLSNDNILDNTSLAEKYGAAECLETGVVLSKLAKHCYSNTRLARHTDALLLSALCLSVPLRLSRPHPQHPAHYASYRMFQLSPNMSLASLTENVSVADLALALEYVAVELIHAEFYVQTLELLTFLQFIAVEALLDPVLSAKARLWKGVALAHLGWFKEAVQNLESVVTLRDFPVMVQKRPLARERDQAYWVSKAVLHTHLPVEQNLDFITFLQKLDVPQTLIPKTSLFCFSLALYLKSLIHFNFVKPITREETAAWNIKNSGAAECERQLRSLLRNLSYEEEVSRYKTEHAPGTRPLAEYLRSRAGEPEVGEVLIKEAIEGGVAKEEESYGESRVRRLKLLLRVRELVAEVRESLGEMNAAAKVLKQNLLNFINYSEGQLDVETGTEHDFGGTEEIKDQGPATKKEAPKKPAAATGAKGADLTSPRQNKTQRQAELKVFYEQWRFRSVPNLSEWLRLKLRLAKVLAAQFRHTEVLKLVQSARTESEAVNEAQYLGQGHAIEAQVNVKLGKIDKVIEHFEQMRVLGERHAQNDPNLSQSLAKYAEFLMERGHHAEAIKVLRQAKALTWSYLNRCGLVILPLDWNKKLDDITVLAVEEVKEVGKPDLKKPAVPPPTEAVKMKRTAVDAVHNSAYLQPNLHLAHLELLVKIEVRLLQACFAEASPSFPQYCTSEEWTSLTEAFNEFLHSQLGELPHDYVGSILGVLGVKEFTKRMPQIRSLLEVSASHLNK
jgi:hypothetical protein